MDYTTVLLSNRNSITMDDYIKLIKKYIDTSTISTIVDAGSMDGSDALLLKHAFSNSIAYAIEGLPNNYNNYIKDNTEIIGINCVIASYDGEITYYEKNINGIHGIYDRGSSYGTHTLTLPCCKFATIINKYNIPTIDILNIDVEGASYDLLLSLEQHIHEIKIMHIETETSPFFKGQILHTDVCKLLEQNNFECIDITFVEIIDNAFQSDSVWINKKYKKH
jgi:FkbM family methyltransferase